MKLLILNIFTIFCCHISAQPNGTIEFGRLNQSDVDLKSCSFEPDAPAVVLFDYGESEFITGVNNGLIIAFKRHSRIKIFNEGGYDQAEIEIPLYIGENDRETVRDIQGYTYNFTTQGLEQIPLDKGQVFEEKINEYWYVKKFAMPKIKDGSIIEISYTIDSPFHIHFRDWEFQNDIPTLYSQYSASMVPFYTYRYRSQGTPKFDHYKSYEEKGMERLYSGVKFRDMIYEFGLKNIPSFQDESYITSRNDYIKKLDFQLVEINHPSGYSDKFMDTWPKLANDLLEYESFGKYLKKSEKWARKNASQFTTLSENIRIDAILEMIKSTYKWNNYYGKYAQLDFNDFQKHLTGNIGNINLLTIGTLRANGIEANPVIISTRDHGKVYDDFPYSDFFNYVLILAKVNDQLRLLDATQGFCPNNLIPDYCINGKGFIVTEDSEQWVSINANTPSLDETTLQYSVNPDNFKIEGECQKRCTGYIALNQRRKYYSDSKKFIKSYEKLGFNVADDFIVSNLSEIEIPFEYSFKFNQNIDVIDQQIILNPFAYFTIKENPFKQTKRTLPVDLVNKKTYRYNVVIKIPDGYMVETMPTDKKLASQDMKFDFMIKQMDKNTLKLYATYSLEKSQFGAEHYTALKSFMNTVTQKLNAKIVLKKDDTLTMK